VEEAKRLFDVDHADDCGCSACLVVVPVVARALATRDAARLAVEQELDRLRVLGPDTEARVVCEARELAGKTLKPMADLWRAKVAEVEHERDALAADLTRERQERTRWQVEAGEARQLVAALIDIASQAAGQPSRIRRVKAYREATRCGLKEALDAVAALDEKHPPGSALDSLLAQARLEGHWAGLEEAATVADGVAAEHERLMWQAREDLEFDLRDEHSSANNGARDAAAAIRAHLPGPR
jgi:ribosomal protein L7/L12